MKTEQVILSWLWQFTVQYAVESSSCFLAIPAFTHTSAALGDMKWRRSRDLSPVEQFMCPLYAASTQSNVDKARLQLPVFSKAKKGLEMLPPLRDALALHNYQAMISLQADHEHIQVPSPAGTSA